VVVAATLLVGSTPVGPWLVRDHPIDRPDAIVVLGSHEHERLPHAAHLAQRWPAARVWLTEPVAPTPFNCQDCPNRGRTLAQAGVDPGRIEVLRPKVRNTWDELGAVAAWVRSGRAHRVLIVTSPYHTRRARGLAAVLMPGVVTGVSACPVPDGLAWPWWSRRYDRRYVVYELGAMLDNSWRHGLPPGLWLIGG
jgi:uncharacterized SAM-binding protein YcdF (DUF218 family)